MAKETVRKKLRVVAAVAFSVAGVASWWTVFEEGATMMRTLPAACVTLACAIWLVMVASPDRNLR